MDIVLNVVRWFKAWIRVGKKIEPQFKRTYDKSDPVHPRVNGVIILRAKPHQRFSPDLILSAMEQGWLSMYDGLILIKGENGNLQYRIESAPGYYCCFCNTHLGSPSDAKMHISAEHLEKISPDLNNPSGYRKDNFYDCTLMESEFIPHVRQSTASHMGVG